MSRRMIHDNNFMQYVMTPPKQEEAKYSMYVPVVSGMRVLNGESANGLGQVAVSNGENRQDWVMPVVIIVVSAMALMTLYAVLSKR